MSDVLHKLVVAYRGTRYHGWQRQLAPPTYKGDGATLPTVQEALERALAVVVGHPCAVQGASRTDAGVHAHGQVASFRTTAVQIPPEGLRRAANARLPHDVVIRELAPAPWPNFDPVRDAVRKRYEYALHVAPTRDAFEEDTSWHRPRLRDVPLLRAAAARFVGTHDFASFAKPGHGRLHCVRTVTQCDVTTDGDRVVVAVEGGGFVWNQVRIMVGTLVDLAERGRAAETVDAMLAARERTAAGPTAPAHGLYLRWIEHEPRP